MFKPRVATAVLAIAGLAFAARVLAAVELSGSEGPAAANVLAFIDLDDEPCDAPRWRPHGRQALKPQSRYSLQLWSLQ